MQFISRFSFAQRKGMPVQLQKLIFDSENKALIFKHNNGEESLKWSMRGGTIFTLLNSFLMIGEYVQPIFGGWNGFSFAICSGIGVSGFALLHMFSRRTVDEIRLYKTGDYVEIKFFNAFWTPQYKTIHCTEFEELTPSYLGYHRIDITSIGKAWINLERNSSATSEETENMLYPTQHQTNNQSILFSLLHGLRFSKKHLKN